MKNLAMAASCGLCHFEFADDKDVDTDVAANAMGESLGRV